MIISRINGFTYVQTEYDYLSADVKLKTTPLDRKRDRVLQRRAGQGTLLRR